MEEPSFPNEMRTLADFQEFHRWLDEQNDFNTDIFFNMMLLSGEIGELAQVLKRVHIQTNPKRVDEVKTLEEALVQEQDDLGQELADCIAYLFKIANYTGIDLQKAYLEKMARNLRRSWKYTQE